MMRFAFYVWRHAIRALQSMCTHPGEHCTADIFEGDLSSWRDPPPDGVEDSTGVAFCRLCGAVQIHGFTDGRKFERAWRRPQPTWERARDRYDAPPITLCSDTAGED